MATGTATLDFTATPSEEATVAVTGQTGIGASSHVEAWFMGDTTVDNGLDAHREAAAMCPLIAENIVAGTGFTIRAHSIGGRVTGTLKAHWAWV